MNGGNGFGLDQSGAWAGQRLVSALFWEANIHCNPDNFFLVVGFLVTIAAINRNIEDFSVGAIIITQTQVNQSSLLQRSDKGRSLWSIQTRVTLTTGQ